MNRIDILYTRGNNVSSRATSFELVESWRKFKIDKDDVKTEEQPSIFKTDFWISTREVITEIEIGKEKQLIADMKNVEFIRRFKEKYKLEEDCGVIYTDASKIDNRRSVGIGIVIEGEECVCASV